MPLFENSLTSKLPRVGTSIFTEMSQMANQYKAINLSQGFPDFDVDDELIKLVKKYLNKGIHQYAPMQGAIQLREAISKKISSQYGNHYHPESEITITAGATQAIFTAISAFVKEEDEVIIFTPAYDCYEPTVELNGGRSVFVQLKSPDFKINWEEVKKLISQKTKMIIINSPHNPTGQILDENDLKELEKITNDSEIIILSDEVYEHIIFDKNQHQSICKYPKLSNRSFAVFSFGKTFHVTGWKMGYCIGPKNLMNEFRKVHQFNVFSCNHPLQLALAEYLEIEEYYLRLGDFYQEKRDYFNDIIQSSRFTIIPSSGTYFQLLNFSNISEDSDLEMCKKLIREHKIASIPISVFYNSTLDEKNLRFCFAKKKETLDAAGEILIKI
ncbi:MAG: methionine aminotransferase [Crocinitomicaceae bacterium]|nr:methionine aminotransferase [Crocinitomicaceae bacterium]|tara:strand:+ start:11098 stop:12255 length:1158 start_codon:yes stop_codon:yes gene_type:complete